jgi:phosphate acyltransferase
MPVCQFQHQRIHVFLDLGYYSRDRRYVNPLLHFTRRKNEMRIVLDAMGSDHYPDPELEAAVIAVQKWDDPLIVAGPEELLRPKLEKMGADLNKVLIAHAPEILQMTDKPAASARGKANSSMAVAMELLKNGEADAFVTAGNTGGAMANGLFRLGRIRGIKRPGLTTPFPVKNGMGVILDIGANADCKPEYLVQFAMMGSIYAEKVLRIPNPRVALMSNGEEAGKGNNLVKETYPLLEKLNLNFVGNVEPKDFIGGETDVVITDGFTGNMVIKSSEAVASFLIDLIKDEIKSSAITSLGGLLARPAFHRVGKVLDSSEYGAAPLLGLRGLVFVGHGRSDAHALVSAIRVARDAVSSQVLVAIEEAIQSQVASHKKEKVLN